MKELEKREQEFREKCDAFNYEFGVKMVTEFFYYWTEPNKSGTKMRWELEKTWDTKRRLITWQRNNQNWNKNATHQQPAKLGTSEARVNALKNW